MLLRKLNIIAMYTQFSIDMFLVIYSFFMSKFSSNNLYVVQNHFTLMFLGKSDNLQVCLAWSGGELFGAVSNEYFDFFF